MKPGYIVALGDIAALVAFGAIGLASHEETVSLEIVARSILTFVVAWFALGPFLGVFPQQGWRPDRRGFVRLAGAWIVAGVIALVARAIIFDRELFSAFFVIALVGNGLFLGGWRAAYGRWFATPATG